LLVALITITISPSPVSLETLRVSLRIGWRTDASREESSMEWTKPEFTVIAVTMEVTAYAATK
jgi:coenzyme PQQ precursor peptide PqqA